jgi:hypothetical protein
MRWISDRPAVGGFHGAWFGWRSIFAALVAAGRRNLGPRMADPARDSSLFQDGGLGAHARRLSEPAALPVLLRLDVRRHLHQHQLLRLTDGLTIYLHANADGPHRGGPFRRIAERTVPAWMCGIGLHPESPGKHQTRSTDVAHCLHGWRLRFTAKPLTRRRRLASISSITPSMLRLNTKFSSAPADGWSPMGRQTPSRRPWSSETTHT